MPRRCDWSTSSSHSDNNRDRLCLANDYSISPYLPILGDDAMKERKSTKFRSPATKVYSAWVFPFSRTLFRVYAGCPSVCLLIILQPIYLYHIFVAFCRIFAALLPIAYFRTGMCRAIGYFRWENNWSFNMWMFCEDWLVCMSVLEIHTNGFLSSTA